MTTQNKIIGAIAVLALIVGFIGWSHPSSNSFGSINNGGSAVNPGNVIVPANTTLVDGYQTPNPSTFDYLVSRGYLVAQNLFGLGNGTSVVTNVQSNRMTLNTATTTPCALQNPLNATTTIVNFSINLTVSTSSAGTFAVGTSTTAFATSTNMFAAALPTNTLNTFTWDPGSNNSVLGPNQWVTVGVAGVATGGFTYGGSCQMVVQTVN